MEAAPQISVYYVLVKSFGVAMWRNSKDYLHLKEVPASDVSGREAVCLSRVLKDVKLQGHQPCSMSLNLWTIHQKCLYWRCVP